MAVASFPFATHLPKQAVPEESKVNELSMVKLSAETIAQATLAAAKVTLSMYRVRPGWDSGWLDLPPEHA